MGLLHLVDEGEIGMGIGERIRHLRNEQGLTRSQLAEMIQVTPSAIANYENGVSSPKPENLISLLSVLQVDANYLFQDYLSDDIGHTFNNRELTVDEREMILRYCDLTEDRKKLICTIINSEYERQTEEKWIQYPCIVQGEHQERNSFLMEPGQINVRFQKKYQIDDMEFCFQILGDQYEPVYKNQAVLAVKRVPAVHNEIGIFKLDGVYYLRMLCQTEGKYRLRALNANEADMEVDDSKKLECIGTVLGQIGGTVTVQV